MFRNKDEVQLRKKIIYQHIFLFFPVISRFVNLQKHISSNFLIVQNMQQMKLRQVSFLYCSVGHITCTSFSYQFHFCAMATRQIAVLREQTAPLPLLPPPTSHGSPSCVGHMQKHFDVKEPQLTYIYVSHRHFDPDCQFMCIFTIRTPSQLLDRTHDIAFPNTEHDNNHDFILLPDILEHKPSIL